MIFTFLSVDLTGVHVKDPPTPLGCQTSFVTSKFAYGLATWSERAPLSNKNEGSPTRLSKSV